jgi:hypothetical protein
LVFLKKIEQQVDGSLLRALSGISADDPGLLKADASHSRRAFQLGSVQFHHALHCGEDARRNGRIWVGQKAGEDLRHDLPGGPPTDRAASRT